MSSFYNIHDIKISKFSNVFFLQDKLNAQLPIKQFWKLHIIYLYSGGARSVAVIIVKMDIMLLLHVDKRLENIWKKEKKVLSLQHRLFRV